MNVGTTDQIIRVLAGLTLLVLAFNHLGGIANTNGIVATVIGAVLIGTSVFSFCPIYRLVGASTRDITN